MAPMSREVAEQVLAEYQEHLESLKFIRQAECPKLDKELKKAIDREFSRFYATIRKLTGLKKNGYMVVEDAKKVLAIKPSAREKFERLVERPGIGMSHPPKFTGGGLPESRR